MAVLLLSTAMIPAAETSHAADSKLTLRCRLALWHDAPLRRFNLGVSVRDNVATLWGAVPTVDLAQRALDKVRRVPGIERVIDELAVESADDPLVQFLEEPRTTPIFGKRVSARPLEWHGIVSPTLKSGTANTPRLGVELTEIMPAIRLPAPPRASSTPVAVPVSATTKPSADLDRLLEALRQASPNPAALRIERRGGVVYLSGGLLTNSAALFDLAQRVARLPGVERVVLPSADADR